jgi:hypothetical protein
MSRERSFGRVVFDVMVMPEEIPNPMALLGTVKKTLDQMSDLDRVANDVRGLLGLSGQAVVSVSEAACSKPGCPPLETIVVFWGADGMRHRFKIFKPAFQVAKSDIPAAWLRRAQEEPEEHDDTCC